MIDLTRMFLRKPHNPRPQTADPAHQQFDRDPGIAGRIEPVDDAFIGNLIALQPDAGGLPAAHGLFRASILRVDFLAQIDRRVWMRSTRVRLDITGDDGLNILAVPVAPEFWDRP